MAVYQGHACAFLSEIDQIFGIHDGDVQVETVILGTKEFNTLKVRMVDHHAYHTLKAITWSNEI